MRSLHLNNELARRAAMRMIAEAPDGYICTVKEPTRTLAQNALMWRMLGELSEQVDWYGQKLTDAEWKDVLTASLKKQKAVPGIDGGFVVLGARTSKMSIAEMSELIELMYAFGAQRGVMFIERDAA